MTSAQRIIKYFALAIAAVIIVSIISVSLTFLRGLSWLTNKKSVSTASMQTLNVKSTELTNLNIKVAFTNLIIKRGDHFKAETNNDLLICKQDGNNLQITEKDEQFFSTNNEESLIIYLPENLIFDKVNINIGAGKTDIEVLDTKELFFEIGAGNAEIKNLNVLNTAEIECGAGKLSIASGNIKDLKLEIGAGQSDVSSKILGNSKIDVGVGNIKLHIPDNKDEYKLKINKGLGSIKIDNAEISDGEIKGNGENYIDIDGGIGNINIDFE